MHRQVEGSMQPCTWMPTHACLPSLLTINSGLFPDLRWTYLAKRTDPTAMPAAAAGLKVAMRAVRVLPILRRPTSVVKLVKKLFLP